MFLLLRYNGCYDISFTLVVYNLSLSVHIILLYYFSRYAFRKLASSRHVFVTILGLDGAGKTTILNEIRFIFKLVTERQEETMPTVGQNVCKGVFGGVNFTFRDPAGTEKFRKYWVDTFKESHVIIFVIDCSNPARFEEVNTALQRILQHPFLVNAPLLILAHKQDIVGATKPEELQQLLTPTLGNNLVWRVQGSATTAGHYIGIEEMLRWVCTVDLRARSEYVEAHKNDPDPT